MYVQANPGRARTEREKEELKKTYTPGENVIPKVKLKKESREEAEDRRLVEEARELSLRDVGLRGATTYERGVRHRPRDVQPDGRTDSSPRRQTGFDRLSANQGAQARQIEHQSSLRSLLSNSDIDSSEMEEEILRQIMEDGILDGIDLDGLDVSQEDELSERIAEAYRRRHGHRTRSRQTDRDTRSSPRSSRHQTSPRERPQHGREGRSPQSSRPDNSSSHPPVSRPYLFDAYPAESSHRRRTSSETRGQSSTNLSPSSRTSSDTQTQAARSATDLSTRPQGHSGQSRTPSEVTAGQSRRTTDPGRLQPRQPSDPESTRSQTRRSPDGRSSGGRSNSGPSADLHQNETVPESPRRAIAVPVPIRSDRVALVPNDSRTSPRQAVAHNVPSQLYQEPIISCNRCGRDDLQYEVHHHCDICNNGNYDICSRCYRLGRGCLHWFGFGSAAMQRYERQTPPDGYPEPRSLPHRLKSRKFLRPSQTNHSNTVSTKTTSDPKMRLQNGPFCFNCSSFASRCFWKCDACNEGEWGFCDECVRQGKCCTHPLLPVAVAAHLEDWTGGPSSDPSRAQTSSNLVPSIPSSVDFDDRLSQSDPFFENKEYVVLNISVKCAICTYPIPPSVTRFHCYVCQRGDYNIDGNCYQRLVSQGAISPDNGPNGWRRCPKGHRMVVLGFDDSIFGQRRIIDKDLVGGHGLRDDPQDAAAISKNSEWQWQEQGQQKRRAARSLDPGAAQESQRSAPDSTARGSFTPPLLKSYPPNGGTGMHVQALWSYWPQEDSTDELEFPKGAEIRECEDINGDWYWGVYCSRKGLFPGNFVRAVVGSS